jgi:NAD(P)-dependent dehydrogenase (short-subunit alcohol dehydrogenase family)
METVLITGVTGLIGSQFALACLKNGYKVAGVYRNQVKFDSLFHDKENIIGIQIDLMEADISDKMAQLLKDNNCLPDYLDNNATMGVFHRMEEDGFVLRENMTGHYIINVAVPYELSWKLANLPNTKLKKIINISSMYGVVPHNPSLYKNPLTETPLQYSVAKAALIHLTKDLAVRFADKGITVNCISYGGVDGRVDDGFKRRFAEVTPLRRMMRPDETPGPLLYLLSDSSDYMTGHNLVFDGGRTVW